MKKLMVAAALAAIIAAPALAADMPVKAPVRAPVVESYSWTGFYLGVSGGAIWGKSQWSTPALGVTFPFNGDGGIVGGTVGFNWQTGAWVFGIEGDYSWTNFKGTQPVCAGLCTSELNSLGTVRGRVGWATSTSFPLMLFVTGGYAFARIENNVIGTFITKSNIDGWTVGGGAEVALGRNFTLKAEYLYVRLDDSIVCTPAGPPCGGQLGKSDFVRPQIVRGGVNYKF